MILCGLISSAEKDTLVCPHPHHLHAASEPTTQQLCGPLAPAWLQQCSATLQTSCPCMLFSSLYYRAALYNWEPVDYFPLLHQPPPNCSRVLGVTVFTGGRSFFNALGVAALRPGLRSPLPCVPHSHPSSSACPVLCPGRFCSISFSSSGNATQLSFAAKFHLYLYSESLNVH